MGKYADKQFSLDSIYSRTDFITHIDEIDAKAFLARKKRKTAERKAKLLIEDNTTIMGQVSVADIVTEGE